MKNRGYRLLGMVVAGAIGGTPALAGCWTDGDADAARMREFQTMLMVATLKCRAAGIDVSAPYNGFVDARRQLLEGANGRLRHHFAGDGGQAGYDRFVTSLANAYGAEQTTPQSCGQVAQLAFDAAEGSVDLAAISAEQVAARTLAGGLCAPDRPAAVTAAVTAAAASPQPSAPPPVALASAAPAAGKAPLPAEVVAAMAVIAAYARDQTAAAPAASPAVATAMLGPPATR